MLLVRQPFQSVSLRESPLDGLERPSDSSASRPQHLGVFEKTFPRRMIERRIQTYGTAPLAAPSRGLVKCQLGHLVEHEVLVVDLDH